MIENEGTEALRATLARARLNLTRQTNTVKSTMALIKLLEEEIQDRDRKAPSKA